MHRRLQTARPRAVRPSALGTLATATAVVFGAAACDRSISLEERPVAEVLSENVRTMREQGTLLPRKVVEPPSTSRRFFEKLDDLDQWLDGAAPWDDGAPAWWEPEVWPFLDERLAPLLPFYDEVANLLAHPDQRAALAAGTSLAYRTSIRSGERNYDKFATPALSRVGRWVNLLCARAVQAGRTDTGTGVVMQSLVNALDLLVLLDDHSTTGTAVCASLENSVLHALRIVGPGPRVDPIELRRVLEPRLAVMGDELRIWDYLRNSVSRHIEITETLLSPQPRPDGDHWLSELDCSRTRLAQRGLDVLYVQTELRSASTLCARLELFGNQHPFQPLIDGVRALHDLSLETYMARYALAINEYRLVENEWPLYLSDLTFAADDGKPPYLACRNKRRNFTRKFNEVRIALIGRASDATDGTSPLLDWIWNDQLLQQFEDRSR